MGVRQLKIWMCLCCLLVALPLSGLAQHQTDPEKKINGQKLFEAFVYFTDAKGIWLKSEVVRFPFGMDDHQLGHEIIHTLIKGPAGSGLEPLWPKDARLNAFFISDHGKAFVDLDTPLHLPGLMDTRTELLTIYSLVNSLTVNIPKIKMVKILVQGEDAVTLAGHLDMEYFYKTNMLIVK